MQSTDWSALGSVGPKPITLTPPWQAITVHQLIENKRRSQISGTFFILFCCQPRTLTFFGSRSSRFAPIANHSIHLPKSAAALSNHKFKVRAQTPRLVSAFSDSKEMPLLSSFWSRVQPAVRALGCELRSHAEEPEKPEVPKGRVFGKVNFL